MAANRLVEYIATGRRKCSIARVRMTSGDGTVVINDRALEQYFGRQILPMIVEQPFVVTSLQKKFNVKVNVCGGGTTGQAEAIRHGISRALVQMDPEQRKALKAAGLMTRDPRIVERKKYGRKKARKRFQYSKR